MVFPFCQSQGWARKEEDNSDEPRLNRKITGQIVRLVIDSGMPNCLSNVIIWFEFFSVDWYVKCTFCRTQNCFTEGSSRTSQENESWFGWGEFCPHQSSIYVRVGVGVRHGSICFDTVLLLSLDMVFSWGKWRTGFIDHIGPCSRT